MGCEIEKHSVIGYPRFKAWTENGDGRDNCVCSRSTTEEIGKFEIKLFCKTVQTANSFEHFYKI
jgi:hypothetical protein